MYNCLADEWPRVTFPPMDTPTKDLTSSTTVLAGGAGIAIFALRAFSGWDVSNSEVSTILDNVMNVKGSLIGIAASAGVIVSRVKAVNFDKSIFATRTFWCSVGKMAAIAMTTLGVGDNQVDMEKVLGSGFDTVTLIGATCTSLLAIYGRNKAEKTIG